MTEAEWGWGLCLHDTYSGKCVWSLNFLYIGENLLVDGNFEC